MERTPSSTPQTPSLLFGTRGGDGTPASMSRQPYGYAGGVAGTPANKPVSAILAHLQPRSDAPAHGPWRGFPQGDCPPPPGASLLDAHPVRGGRTRAEVAPALTRRGRGTAQDFDARQAADAGARLWAAGRRACFST
jgi:hypothetical protein